MAQPPRGPPRPLMPLPVMAFPALPRPFAAPFMLPLPPAAAVVGPAPHPHHHPIGLAFGPLPFAPRPMAPAIADPAHPLFLPLALLGLPDPAATRRSSAAEEMSPEDADSKEEHENRFAPPNMRGVMRDESSSDEESSSNEKPARDVGR